jgi:serine/threonine-protein phosphatase 2A regulatory subunit B
VFEDDAEDPAGKSYFSEITASVSGVVFLPGEQMATRDYLSVKIWDTRIETRPVAVIPVHEHLRPRLCDLYENDSIFDKFEIAASSEGRSLITGTYNDTVKIFDTQHRQETRVSLSRVKSTAPAVCKTADPTNKEDMMAASADPAETLDFARKVLHYAWHAESDTVAIAGLNNLHIYNASRQAADPGDA